MAAPRRAAFDPHTGIAAGHKPLESCCASIGWALVLVCAPLTWLLARSTPGSCGLPVDGDVSVRAESTGEADPAVTGATLAEALRSPAFWVLALVGNFAGGAFAQKGSLRALMAAALLLLTFALAALPFVSRQWHVVAWAVVMGLAGGFVMVIFLSFWGRVYGRAQLGRIQGAAQILTVLALAVGPLLLARCVAATGSYASAFYVLAGIVALLGIAAAAVPVPAAAAESRTALVATP